MEKLNKLVENMAKEAEHQAKLSKACSAHGDRRASEFHLAQAQMLKRIINEPNRRSD